jgi:PAS domain S-box-containing protein
MMNNRLKFFVLLILQLALLRSHAQEQKHVLLINSYNSSFPTFFQQIQGIKSVLDTANTTIDVEFMDSKRFNNPATRSLFHKTLANKLSQFEKYDVIITTDDNAFNFALDCQGTLFKNIPIVFCGVHNINKALDQKNNPHITGIVEEISMKETVELMIKFFPGSENIYAISDSTDSGLADLNLYRQVAEQFPKTDFKEIDLNKYSFQEYEKVLQEIPPDIPVLLLSAYSDKLHHTISFEESLSILKKNTKAPLFHLWEYGMGKGFLGGKLISHYEQGKTAAMFVYGILSGQPIASIKGTNKIQNIFKFDYNQLVKYNIDVKKLPQGSIVINRPETFFYRNKRIILFFTGIFIVLVTFILVLFFNIIKRKRIEIQLKNQNSDFSKLNAELLLAKKKAEEGEYKFKQLFYEHSSVKLLIEEKTGRIIDANPTASEFYGWSIEQLTQMHISDINTLPLSEVQNEMRKASEQGKTHFEFRHRKADGSIADVETITSNVTISGKKFFYSIINDISDKKKNEHKIQLLSRSVEQSPVIIVITDKEGTIEYVNPAFTTSSGYSSDEITGKNLQTLKSSCQPDETYKNLWETILSGKIWTETLQTKKKSGESYWINVAISPIYKNSDISNFVAVSEDITEKKKMIEDLIAAKEKAEESSRLKTEFLHNMSHEIRTPMNGIIGFSDMLSNKNISNEERTQFAVIIKESSLQLLSIIDDILEISRLETHQASVHLEEFCLNTLLNELHTLFSLKAKEKNLDFKLKTEMDNDKSFITTDKTRMNRILSNLLENAFKFTNKGFIELGYYLKKDQIILYVKDTGIGVLPENLNYIFERFTQEEKELSRKYGGLGLGLSISRENARLLKGEITVESEKNKGSTFYFSTPYTSSRNSQTEPASGIRKIDTESNISILLAEDEKINYLYIKTLLKNNTVLKINLLHAVNGKEAIDLCIENPNIDLVLMDLRMPVLDGFEATKEIKSRFPHLPVIALTAYSTEADRELAFKYGCDDFISKPVYREKLFELIYKYLKL